MANLKQTLPPMREPTLIRHPEPRAITARDAPGVADAIDRTADRGSRSATRRRIAAIEDLQAHLSEREAEIAGCHRALAARLQDLGDGESAALLVSLLDEPTRAPGPAVTCRDMDFQSGNPVQLLAAAQKPLERLSEELADVLEAADTELFVAAEHALTNVVGRLARLVSRIEGKLHEA